MSAFSTPEAQDVQDTDRAQDIVAHVGIKTPAGATPACKARGCIPRGQPGAHGEAALPLQAAAGPRRGPAASERAFKLNVDEEPEVRGQRPTPVVAMRENAWTSEYAAPLEAGAAHPLRLPEVAKRGQRQERGVKSSWMQL